MQKKFLLELTQLGTEKKVHIIEDEMEFIAGEDVGTTIGLKSGKEIKVQESEKDIVFLIAGTTKFLKYEQVEDMKKMTGYFMQH